MSDSEQARPDSVLVVDDDELFRTALARALRTRGYDARSAGSYDEAVKQIHVEPPQIAVVDLQMPGRSGLELIDAIKRMYASTIVLVLTADRSPQSMATARQRGASSYLTKPIDADRLVAELTAVTGRTPKGNET